MPLHKFITMLIAVGVLAGCASSPDSMQAQKISTVRYDAYTCDQLVAEMNFSGQRASELYGLLNKKAGDDAAQMGIGLVLFWPALFFLEGGDGAESHEYTRLRGELQAMQVASVHKNCDVSKVRPFAPAKPANVPESNPNA